MNIYVVDRIEEGFAVCENKNGRQLDLEISHFKDLKNIKQGDVVVEENGTYRISQELTKERRKKIIDLQNDLWE